jgi:RNA:NAD 2'-phosphotransferase (TPT1/KptA family)
MAQLVRIGKKMVGALRHGHYGAVLEQQTGWLSIDTLALLLQVGEDDIQQVLQADRTDRKSRFESENRAGALYVRAKRGWSLSSGVTLAGAMDPIGSAALPDYLFHATDLEYQQSIITHGLLCGTDLQRISGRDRSHVHWFACQSVTLLERARVLRSHRTIFVVVRPRVLQAHGVSMFVEQSQHRGSVRAVLTDVVGPRLLEHILDRRTQRVTEAWLVALQREFTERQSPFFF